jgi:hypothetical protein
MDEAKMGGGNFMMTQNSHRSIKSKAFSTASKMTTMK